MKTNSKTRLFHAPGPKGLFEFTFAEFWDRFSFCGTLTILILYLTKTYSFSDSKAYAAWGAYTALGYITPVLGGLLADRILGFEKPIFIGLLLMAMGNGILAISHNFFSFCLGISLTTCGIGLFKGNVSSLVGMLYQTNDPKKEQGYSYFFMGIILGAILGPAVYGFLTIYFSWQTGFMLSAFGHLFSLLLLGTQKKQIQYQRLPTVSTNKWLLAIDRYFYYGLAFIILLISFSYAYPSNSNRLFAIISISSILLITILALRGSKEDKLKILGLTFLDLLLVSYYAASAQVNGSLVVGIERNFHIALFGITIPATFFASLEALFAFLLTPIFAKFWIYLKQNYFDPSLMLKIGIGHVMAGISFFIFSWEFFTSIQPLSAFIAANLFLGISVVCIFPAHLSAVSQYAPSRLQGLLMGMSYLSSALSGYLGSLVTHLIGNSSNKNQNALMYAPLYLHVALLMSLIGFFIFLTIIFLRNKKQAKQQALVNV